MLPLKVISYNRLAVHISASSRVELVDELAKGACEVLLNMVKGMSQPRRLGAILQARLC